MNNFGYILYVLLGIVGGAMAISALPNFSLTGRDVITLGMIASFLQLSRSFIHPLAQVSQQMNAVIMALAGAERIFELMDQESEQDEGYVTLVNAKIVDGEISQTQERTEHWAWRHPHQDGTVTFEELKGEVNFYDVDFGYNAQELVLHDISLHAKPGEKNCFSWSDGSRKNNNNKSNQPIL